MDTNPEVELTVACGYGDVGFRMRPNALVRDWLLAMGYAKIVEAEQPSRPAKLAGKAAAKLGVAIGKLV